MVWVREQAQRKCWQFSRLDDDVGRTPSPPEGENIQGLCGNFENCATMPKINGRRRNKGISLLPVLVSPDEFGTFCKEKRIDCNNPNRAQFASSPGTVSYSLEL
jgi:hypothetical protein